jgi:hypothetical protein
VPTGLWNYAEAPTALADDTPLGDDSLELYCKLVNFAKAQGGHDNITVWCRQALARTPRTAAGGQWVAGGLVSRYMRFSSKIVIE